MLLHSSAIPDNDIAEFLRRAFDPAQDHGSAAAGPVSDDGEEATLRLLRNCVEAMTLMQARVEDLQAKVDSQSQASEAIAALRADLSLLQAAQAQSTIRLEDTAGHLTRLDTTVQEMARHHADDIAGARTEAANWRMRVETDAMAFDQLSKRMSALEEGLAGKLDDAQVTIAEQAAENTRLKAETKVAENIADRLRTRLASVDATIADQRARISCLQNKLATATYAIRFENMSRTMDGGPELPARILDLANALPAGLVSAA